MKLGTNLQNRRGAAMIELAVITTLLSLVVLGSIDFARISYHAMALTNAARAGALHGAQPGNSTDFTGMRNAALNSAAQDIGAITVPTPTKSCECQVGNGAPTVMASCASACAGTVRARVRVSASKTFSTVIRFPGLPSSVTVTRVAILRAQ
jgi:Flp pilus assembly protein TadG